MVKERDEQGPEYGSAFQLISTRSQAPKRRFDYWRSLNHLVDLELPDREGLDDFKANLLRYVAADGTEFGWVAGDDTIARFSAPSGDFVLFSMALSGSVLLRNGSDPERLVTPASGFSVVDGTRPLTTATSNHSHLDLSIPRRRVTEALGDHDAALETGFLTLPPRGLAHFLAGHLQLLATHGSGLDEQSAGVALDIAVDLALGSLDQAAARTPFDHEGHDDALMAAARRYIGVNVGTQALSAAEIAAALGCSRSHLFRVFERRGQTLSDAVNVARFDRAIAMLSAAAPPSIELIATRSGFSSAAVFARAFRRRYGLTPSEFRESRRHS